jgi:bifunctional non-homologous end joining protein LigD
MLATLADAPLQDARCLYEPKYDGIRALCEVDVDAGADVKGAGAPRIRIWSRNGNDKTSQFPEIVAALAAWGAARRRSVLLDGEIVAVDASGATMGFQRLQDRIHLTVGEDVARLASKRPVVLVAFDLLRDGGEDLRARPLVERRVRLEEVVGGDLPAAFRLSQIAVGDGTALHQRALAEGWEGLIVKNAASIYRPGQRSLDWRKLKLPRRAEFVVGGWTEPRRSRARFGALLLGEPAEGGKLRYVGHTGSGFTEKDLQRIGDALAAREIAERPFTTPTPANERPHWVRPELVVEVRFTDYSDDRIIRHAVFIGLRDDVWYAPAPAAGEARAPEEDAPDSRPAAAPADTPAPAVTAADAATALPPSPEPPELAPADAATLVAALDEIERSRSGAGTLQLPDGARVDVTNLGKKLWPELGVTKGDLFRYYIGVAPYILPVVRDRALVMRRFPNGVDRPAFYQQRGPDEVPAGVRVEAVDAGDDIPTRMVGGSLATLLYMTQLAAISQDPWFSRVQSLGMVDFVAIDLDPLDGTPFSSVLDVARWTHDQLDALGVVGYPKTSGVSGLHIYLPMQPGTPYAAGLLFCQIIATLVAGKHPQVATIERTVRRRAQGTVYVDYLQNIEGKTIACAYSARASEFAGASTPLTWDEVDRGVDPRDFTVRTLPARLATVGDLWAGLRRSPGIDLQAALDRARLKHGKVGGGPI